MSEKNELNVYNHLETIRKAADALETIHVYEVNARSFGSSKDDELKTQIVDLENQVLNYEMQLAQLQDEIDQKTSVIKSLTEANNKLIEINKRVNEDKELTDQEAERIVVAYNKLPRIVKKIYGVK